MSEKPVWEMTGEEFEAAPHAYAEKEYVSYTRQASEFGVVLDQTAWLEMRLWNEVKTSEEIDERFGKLFDELWQLVYPGQTDWEYPGMVYRHVRDYIDELKAKAQP